MSAFTSQREAARHFVNVYCEDKGITVEGDMKEVLSKDDQRNIATIMATAACEGEIVVKSEKYYDQETYEKYFKGQLNDALRKDKELNGGDPYQAKNPGKFKNAGDSQVKAMRALLKLNPENKEEIEEAIVIRQKELAVEKVKVLTDAEKETLKGLGLGHLIG